MEQTILTFGYVKHNQSSPWAIDVVKYFHETLSPIIYTTKSRHLTFETVKFAFPNLFLVAHFKLLLRLSGLSTIRPSGLS